ncbi:hypothetical protein FCK19_22675 [Salmonella enterica]|nr:hypothetical protein [Salmonella enterica]
MEGAGAACGVVQKTQAFPLLGLDVDNGAEFINEALFEYCSARCTWLINDLLTSFSHRSSFWRCNVLVSKRFAGMTHPKRLIERHTLRADLRGYFDDIIHALAPLKLLEIIRLYQH